MARIRIGAPFWDGQQLHLRGAEIEWPEGVDMPPRSVRLDELPTEVEDEEKPDPTPVARATANARTAAK